MTPVPPYGCARCFCRPVRDLRARMPDVYAARATNARRIVQACMISSLASARPCAHPLPQILLSSLRLPSSLEHGALYTHLSLCPPPSPPFHSSSSSHPFASNPRADPSSPADVCLRRASSGRYSVVDA
ncbi:hypothetical protein B0H14DRAFT_3436310 [Mycena olivaceomarginata]|nr:hypothetical protein B0H14DRAFT_3436310 [Mycena olivaceomarginata]